MSASCPAEEHDYHHVLHQVLTRLENKGIEYCLLRNRDRIPSFLPLGSDVDLVVPRSENAASLANILRGLPIVHIIPRISTSTFYLSVSDRFLRVDFIHSDKEWLGAVYLENEEILRDAWIDDGIPVASVLHQAFDVWLGNLLWNGEYRERYRNLIQIARNNNAKGFDLLLRRALGSKRSEDLLSHITQPQSMSKRELTSFRMKIWGRAALKHPIRTKVWIDRYLIQQIAFRFKTPGLTLTILGPDGAGKSTICSVFSSFSYPDIPFSGVEIDHLYRRVLPSLSDLRKGRISRIDSASDAQTPHNKRTHGSILSTVRLTYFVLDHWISESIWGRNSLARNRVRIYDRHLIELPVDPARYRYGGSSFVARILVRMAPSSNIVILLDAPAHSLQQRKQEVPFLETHRQVVAYRDLIHRLPNGHIVNADRSTDEIVSEVMSIVVGYLTRRTAQRYPSLFLNERKSQ